MCMNWYLKKKDVYNKIVFYVWLVICKCNIIVKYFNEMCFYEIKCMIVICVMIVML